MPVLASSVVVAAALFLAAFGPAFAQSGECGLMPGDWCPAPAGDPCGRHRNANECRADPKCSAMVFRGPSKVACLVDRRGFSLNCPAVGCRSSTAKGQSN
jgi:hypothetical protein